MSQSDVMKGVIEKIEGRNIKKAEFSIMAFFADESIQRKYPRRFGCFKMCLPEFCSGSIGSTTFYWKRTQLCRTDPGLPTPGPRGSG